MRGHIKQRSKGTWSLVVFLGRDPVSGKKRYKWRTVKGTKKQAESELSKLLREIETGTDLEPGRLTTGEFLEQWLDASRSRVGPRTWERYAQLIRLHVVPVLGPIPLGKLRPLHLEQLYSKVLQKGLAARTVLHVHRVLHSALRQAVRWQLVPRNVAGAVTPPRPVTRDIEAIDPEQAVRLIESVKGTLLEVPVGLALGAGMRRGEVLGLRWKENRPRLLPSPDHADSAGDAGRPAISCSEDPSIKAIGEPPRLRSPDAQAPPQRAERTPTASRRIVA